jgi:hypothetical protein
MIAMSSGVAPRSLEKAFRPLSFEVKKSAALIRQGCALASIPVFPASTTALRSGDMYAQLR